VQKYYEQMVDGSFVSVGRGVGGNIEGVARYVITEGNHRVTAAAWYGMKTGDYTHLQNLLRYGNWREGIFRGTKNIFARVWNP
jgi:hypothetical protein